MKRILCLIDSLGAGGAQRQMVGLATFLKEKGYDVLVATYHDVSFYADVLMSKDVPFVFLKDAERNSTRLFVVARYIKNVKPDVVISYLDVPNICACFTRLTNRNFKLLVSERNTTQVTGRKEKIRFNMFRLANYVVPNAYSQAEYIKKTFPFLESRLATIPNFVDLQRFAPAYHQRHEIPEILVVATIWQSKNTLGFIDAVELLAQKGIPFHISWYGKINSYIDYFNACQAKIDEKGLNDYICLLDKTNEISDRYREADYFCLPSFYEGTPNAICEAMASGLPIICSDVCDNSRYVVAGENGKLFNPKNVESMAANIEAALQLSDEEYTAYCKSSRAISEDKFSKDRFTDEYVNLIES